MSRGFKIAFIVIGAVIVVSLVGLGVVAVLGRNQTYRVAQIPFQRQEQNGENLPASTLTIDQAKTLVDAALAKLNIPDLALKEIMIFQNNAYARIVEKSTGIGAMEWLVDPSTRQVYPEYGASMMWNLKYGMMSSGGGGMMNPGYNLSATPQALTSPFSMPVTADQVVKIAQQYLDNAQPGTTADPNPDEFYGYYTIDILKNDSPVGMLSVNGYSGQIIYHDWHGGFISQQEW